MRGLAVVVLLILGGCAAPQTPTFPLTDAQFRPYADFIRSRTPYAIITQPKWVILSDDQMRHDITEATGMTMSDPTIVPGGYYACQIQTVFLPQSLHIGTIAGDTYMLHELTHHAQCLAHRDMTDCAVEREAYKVQNDYLGLTKEQEKANAQLVAEIDRNIEFTTAMVEVQCQHMGGTLPLR